MNQLELFIKLREEEIILRFLEIILRFLEILIIQIKLRLRLLNENPQTSIKKEKGGASAFAGRTNTAPASQNQVLLSVDSK